MLLLGGVAATIDDGIARARQGLQSGVGLTKFREMVTAQGGDPAVVDCPELLTRGLEQMPIALDRQGMVTGLDARQIGFAIRELKTTARERKHYCGLLLMRKAGDQADGTVAALLYPAGARNAATAAANRIRAAYRVGTAAAPAMPLVAATIYPRPA
jgi:thymidine phosphorylase